MKNIYYGISRFFKFGSIQSNIAGVFSFLILFSIIYIGFITYKVSSDVVEKNTREYMNELIGQVNINIETYITYMENISLVALNNKDIGLYFSKNNFSEEEKESSKNKIVELFDSILYARTDIASISIFGYDGNFISDSENFQLNEFADIEGQSWYENAVKANGQIAISPSHVQNIINNKYRWVVSLSRELKSQDGKEKLGIFLADLNFKVISDICSKVKLGKRGYIFIIDNDGKIVFHPQQQLLYSNLKTEIIDEVLSTKENSFIVEEGKDSRIYTIQTSDYSGWKIVGVAYVDELFANKKRIYMYYVLGGVVFVAIVVLLSILLSLRISKPVKLLEASMKEVQKGNFDIKVDIKDPEEIKKLSKAFNIMTTKIKDLINQNIKEQELKRKSEIKALQAQINPHFLYNTLDSIIWMAESKKSEDVVVMASALAKLFRFSISKGEEIVSLRTEIEHIKNYLTIQKIRYTDKLDFSIEVNDDILHCKTLKIILQPLVENSIYHGIKNKNGIGLIRITGKMSDNKILLQVIDNGVGMTPDKLHNILSKKDTVSNNRGVGVWNVHERIKLYFGDEFGLVFESEVDVGTKASIWLPLIE